MRPVGSHPPKQRKKKGQYRDVHTKSNRITVPRLCRPQRTGGRAGEEEVKVRKEAAVSIGCQYGATVKSEQGGEGGGCFFFLYIRMRGCIHPSMGSPDSQSTQTKAFKVRSWESGRDGVAGVDTKKILEYHTP